ncbi:hypothetical protein Tco_1314144 [Tanacetum coccineum]
MHYPVLTRRDELHLTDPLPLHQGASAATGGIQELVLDPSLHTAANSVFVLSNPDPLHSPHGISEVQTCKNHQSSVLLDIKVLKYDNE